MKAKYANLTNEQLEKRLEDVNTILQIMEDSTYDLGEDESKAPEKYFEYCDESSELSEELCKRTIKDIVILDEYQVTGGYNSHFFFTDAKVTVTEILDGGYVVAEQEIDVGCCDKIKKISQTIEAKHLKPIT